MKWMNKALSVLLSISLVAGTLSGCAKNNVSQTPVESSVEAAKESVPVTISVIDEKPAEKETVMAEEAKQEDAGIKSLVVEAVRYDLEHRGYLTEDCAAFSNDNSYLKTGIGYYDPEFKIFEEPAYNGMGFVTVIGPEEQYEAVSEESEYIAIEPIEGSFDNGADYNLLAYTCESIEPSHFVYQDQYVMYYQLDSTTVKFETFDNKKDNYDLTIGSLYNFDNGSYIYNAALFDEYKMHSGTQLYNDIDYDELQSTLQELAAEQEKNGYYVEELNIVYISPESIEAYLASEEEDTFFGYSVSELENSLGPGTALVYTENGFETAEYFASEPENYNWKSFLAKVGIGCGIILVGAVLTPVTGGASFGCALITISKVTVGMALSSGLGTLAIETVTNMIHGQDFADAIKHASGKGLDAFANGFMIGAVIGSVGVVSGVIKPVACFTAGTLVMIPDMFSPSGYSYKAIEDIQIGDTIISYDECSKQFEADIVADTMVRLTDSIVIVSVDGQKISSSIEHPYFNPKRETWVAAGLLKVGDPVLTIDGDIKTIDDISTKTVVDTTVYNITVQRNHSYCIGGSGIIVHNECQTVDAARQKAVREEWKHERDRIIANKSKYNWTSEEIDEILKNNKLSEEWGYHGCHIVDVHVNPELAADPNNIIFLKKEVHLRIVHRSNWKNDSHWGEIVKMYPKFRKQIVAIGGQM